MSDNLTVESAPDSMDLEALLGMSSIDLGDATPTGIEVMSEDNIPIDEPHIKVPIKKLVDVLKVSSMISAAGENSFEGKVVMLKIEPGLVRFLLSDNKRTIEKRVEILNTENQFTGTVAFSTSLLARLTKVCSSIFILIERTVVNETTQKEQKKYALKIRGGEIYLDNIQMSEDKFVKSYDDPTIKEFNKVETAGIIKSLFSFASTAIKSGKNIDFLGKVVEASPINSLAKVYTESEYPTFKISLTDAKILYALCMGDDSPNIGINNSGKVFTGNTFGFRTESYAASNCNFDSVAERMFQGNTAIVDAQHLIQISDLSCGLDTSTGNLKFNYSPEGRVVCELLTKRENSNITVQGTSNTDLVPMEKPIEIPAMNLRGALTIFASETTLSMCVSPDGISLINGNTKVAILGKPGK